ncbi:MAG: thymidine phosphorylase [Candidatus Eremiobacteraeota bacterium]|nr:thymidine phosphorylase [Candidatus Eremiobacteraeota bacterium]
MDGAAMRGAIERKREGLELPGDAWRDIVASFMDGSVDDAQLAALCMACVWRGMTLDETFALTDAMVQSGETLHFEGPVVDKHSTGGVSDIVSLVAVPLAAACGARVAKLSGRALGHTGGTIDKLETIPGFNVNLSPKHFVEQVQRIGCAIAAQSATLVPADKRIYELRDRTATVPAMGLIAASIVSKKVAGGATAFVFDVKTGGAAFMREVEQAHALARLLVDLAKRFGRTATALITDMNQPLGRSIGTGLEVIEARDFLRNVGVDERARALILRVVGTMLRSVGIDDGDRRAGEALTNGTGYAKFVELIEVQGSTRAALEAMAPGEPVTPLRAAGDGTIAAMDTVGLGNRARVLSSKNAFAGITVLTRIGDAVKRGDVLANVIGAPSAETGEFFTLTRNREEAPMQIYDEI